MGEEYRYLATSVSGFVQQLAVSYLTNGYWFYVLGEVPEGKSPEAIDEKLLLKYGVERSKWANARAWKRGEAKVHYLRYARVFVLVATHDVHLLDRFRVRRIRIDKGRLAAQPCRSFVVVGPSDVTADN